MGITTDLEAAFPTDEKGVAFDSLVRRHSSCFPCFARVCILYLIYKYGIIYVHFSVRFVTFKFGCVAVTRSRDGFQVSL